MIVSRFTNRLSLSKILQKWKLPVINAEVIQVKNPSCRREIPYKDKRNHALVGWKPLQCRGNQFLIGELVRNIILQI